MALVVAGLIAEGGKYLSWVRTVFRTLFRGLSRRCRCWAPVFAMGSDDRRKMSVPIGARTQLLGVMGWPVEHSLSPATHNAVLARLGLNWCYLPLRVHPTRLIDAIRGAAALGFGGVNVTVPHKQGVMAAMDWDFIRGARRGAVNTVVISARGEDAVRMDGHNTDVAGFIGSLRAGGLHPAQSRSARWSGRAVQRVQLSTGASTAGAGRVTVLNRTRERAERLVADLGFVGRGRLHVEALGRMPTASWRRTPIYW